MPTSRRGFLAGIAALPALASPGIARDAVALPDAVVTRGTRDIRDVTLIGPTQRYDHFVLGSRHEAAGIRITAANGKTSDLILPPDSVFEDREPRLADLDGDGRDEIIVVRSRLSSGSALAVIGLRDGRPIILAETPPNGGPRRWLNPAGFGHFTATDRLQVAMVRMPHVVGRLEFWDFDGKQMTLKASLDGVSNHHIGTRNLHLSAAIARLDQTDLLAIPSLDRRALLTIECSAGHARIVGRVALSSPADGNFMLSGDGAATELGLPLADGSTRRVAVSEIITARLR